MDTHQSSGISMPESRTLKETVKTTFKETLYPDDPFRNFKNHPPLRRFILVLQYYISILEWAPHYSLSFFKSDLISGVTIASMAIPQGISYAKLANLPPILGLYGSFVPPLVYAVFGSSRDLAVGPVAVASLLMASIMTQTFDPVEQPMNYLYLAYTATFFAGAFQALLGILRLGFIVDFLSHATILGFMSGSATVVVLQQIKGLLGLHHFTHSTDIISVLHSIFTQTHLWRWESFVMGCVFISLLFYTKAFSKRKPKYFWVYALTPLVALILGSLFVFFTHTENRIDVIEPLKKGLNPISVKDLHFRAPFLRPAFKTGIIVGIIGLTEGIAVGRSFAMYKNYHIDGNKEMTAFGAMNMVGSLTSCYLSAGPFSRSAVNYNAGCKTAMSNIIMAIAVMCTLLFLTPLFHYTPQVVLSSIIITAMLSIIDYMGMVRLWKVDKFDFIVCLSAYIGVVFGSVEIGLSIALGLSMLRVILSVARPGTHALGNIPNSKMYRCLDQYPTATSVPGILIISIDTPIYFINANYLRERLTRWMDEEQEKSKAVGIIDLQYVILDMSGVSNIDESGIRMIDEVKKVMIDHRGLTLLLANPVGEVVKKLSKSHTLDAIGENRIYLTVEEAVGACDYLLHDCSPTKSPMTLESETFSHV